MYYFTLPEGWEPKDVGNEAALGMLQRFIHDGREQDKYVNILRTLMTCFMTRVLHDGRPAGLCQIALWGSVR